jgi:hypothetical protein
MAIDYSQLDQARNTAQGAQQSAIDYSARGATLPDELRKALGERYGQSGMAQDAATARTDFMASIPQARADVAGMTQGGTPMSPTQIQAILAAKRGAALIPVIASNLNQEAAFGNIEDLVGAGTRAWQSQVAQKQGAAELAQSGYTNLLSELFRRAEEERAAELHPLQKQQLMADIARTQGLTTGEGGSEVGGKSIDAYAVMFNQGKIAASDIPSNVRAKVLKKAVELQNVKPKKTTKKTKPLVNPTSLIGQGTGWLSNQLGAVPWYINKKVEDWTGSKLWQ